MGRLIDLTNKRFGMLTVISQAESIKEKSGLIRARWNCKCDCGKDTVVLSSLLRNEHVKSCGCLKHTHSYNFRDLTGKKFGMLTVIGIESTKNGKAYFKCVCDCGNEKTVRGQELIKGSTSSCGCYKKEYMRKKNTKHGLSNSKIRNVYKDMLSRCENEKDVSYKNYGGRGIAVCEEWHDFKNFSNWAFSQGYTENKERATLTLDRIDVNGNYEPSNCKLSTYIEQARNKRNNRYFILNGEKIILEELSKITGINRNTISYRIKSGKTVSEAIGGYFNENEIKEIECG